ncbi:hypothetical protein FB45DRAFT_55700 [Roridomyces roridus]|uniref:Uncharacterized protein n=1 Tax=Roridomyces roridus TaxID=1738132 RepID=A0AAD7FLM5_9AGAR|nr:hypothetical protein FB45DRAFT_55700 [Roridomyces roridus]
MWPPRRTNLKSMPTLLSVSYSQRLTDLPTWHPVSILAVYRLLFSGLTESAPLDISVRCAIFCADATASQKPVSENIQISLPFLFSPSCTLGVLRRLLKDYRTTFGVPRRRMAPHDLSLANCTIFNYPASQGPCIYATACTHVQPVAQEVQCICTTAIFFSTIACQVCAGLPIMRQVSSV